MKVVPKRLGDMLLEAKLITPEQLESALEVKKSSGARLGEVLVSLGFVNEMDVAQTIAKQLGIPFVTVGEVKVDAEAARVLKEDLARQHRAVAIERKGNFLTVLMADPLNVFAVDDIAFMTGCEVKLAVATEKGIDKALSLAYQSAPEPARDPTAKGEDLEVYRLREMLEEAPIVRLVNQIVDRAIEDRASDIHLEPLEDAVRVRYRVDGMLREVMNPPKANHAATVSRIKIMGEMDISERRIPQDGRIEIKDKGRNVDVRVSTMPTIFGEKVVMRLLDKSRAITKMDDLGMDPEQLKTFRGIVRRPTGIILVSGPTGSGKTSTINTVLREINDVTKNIVTIEDPVEYQIPGVNQTAVNERAGYTFASGLRSILRQDPNIVMVGEIRDTETADIAVRGSLTGHLVFSTIHTNSASATFSRLVDMGVEPFLLASSVVGILAQRLARVLCKRCREPYEVAPGAEERYSLGLGDGPLTLYRTKGCSECLNSGYKGRTGIFELLVTTPRLREMVLARTSADAIQADAVKGGMKALLEDGAQKVLKGITSVDEVLRVAYSE
jgi:type IV pilus assembly protein PilB